MELTAILGDILNLPKSRVNSKFSSVEEQRNWPIKKESQVDPAHFITVLVNLK